MIYTTAQQLLFLRSDIFDPWSDVICDTSNEVNALQLQIATLIGKTKGFARSKNALYV